MRWLAVLALMACGSEVREPLAPKKAPAPPTPAVRAGCGDARFRENPVDPAARGPWGVGARTVRVGSLTAEVWYPASRTDGAKLSYDTRVHLPASEASKVPDADNPLQTCDCVRDLPLDTQHGPYPVIVFVHGTASFRHQSLAIVTHWASRGFVVVAADHAGLRLGDVLGVVCGGPATTPSMLADVDQLLAAIRAPSGELSFLAAHVDPARIAVAGHSAGASVAAAAADRPGVEVMISLAGVRAPTASPALRGSLFLGGKADAIVPWSRVEAAWKESPEPHHLIGIERAGHLAFSDLCSIKNARGQTMLEVGKEHELCGAALAGMLFDCAPTYLPDADGWSIIRHATSTVLEPILQCAPARDLDTIGTAFPGVEYRR